MRYNVFRKYANDVFGECDFTTKKVPKSCIIRLFRKSPRSEVLPKRLLQRNDGLILHTRYASALRLMLGALHLVVLHHNARGAIFLGSLTSELADSLCVDYPAQVTTPQA